MSLTYYAAATMLINGDTYASGDLVTGLTEGQARGFLRRGLIVGDGTVATDRTPDRATLPGLDIYERTAVSVANAVTATGVLYLSYFTAPVDESYGNVLVMTGLTAAAATPSLCRIGLYATDGDDLAEELTSTVSDTALFSATLTGYTVNFSAPQALVRDERYAVGVLVVSGAATPNFAQASSLVGTLTPFLSARITGLTDLPSAFPATPTAWGVRPWARLGLAIS